MEKGTAFNLYRDIAERTDGDVYIGVVGPVRTGKSTFIARFMEQLVLPKMPQGPRRERVADELPQSASGRTIMTTQPKFVPGEAVTVALQENTAVRIRLVDSVGYLVKGALGVSDDDGTRMVHTPWFDQDIPFDQAAEVGTRKVMTDHATIGMVVTTDGSITEIPRGSYVEAEERVVNELKALGKPFVIVLNSATPRSMETLSLRDALEDKYAVPVMLLNVKEMQVEDIQHVLESVLLEFPLREAHLTVPTWLGALDTDHWLVSHVLDGVREAGKASRKMRETDVYVDAFASSEYAGEVRTLQTYPGEGRMDFALPLKDGLFNRVLGEECGREIRGDAHLLSLMKELVSAKAEYDHIAEALHAVRETGYGLVTPTMAEMTLQEPEIVRQGGQFGVKLKAHAPSLHMIRVDIETEVTPVVGTEKQSEELVRYLMDEFENDPQQIWSTNFFGKSLHDMVREGLSNKLLRMPDDAREKVQETLTRIINDGDGGMICILL
ncbi:MAG: stage IV sporulation protein A [Christensenellaceae bacterium]|nr:stage IV sporulation protein A [Christensenellaceae bacterium]